MSQENVEVLRRGLEALNARSAADIERLVAPDAEWRPILTVGGDLERPVYRGPAGLVQYWTDLDDLFEGTEMHVEELEPIGPKHVLFGGRVTARGRKSGVPIDERIWAVWELRDGKLLRGTAHRTKAEALEAMRLREPAMPTDSKELATRITDAVNERDLDKMSAMFHPEFEFHSAIAASEGHIYRGIDGMEQYFEDVDAVWEEFQIELQEVRDVGERVVVVYRVKGKSRSGVPLDQAIGQVWTLRDGMPWRNESYTNPKEALEAVGLSD